MYVRRFGAGVEVWAPAKLNLFLEVRRKRPDGFHEIVTLMTAVSIYDTLRFVAHKGPQIDFRCGWANSLNGRNVFDSSRFGGEALGELPESAANIAVQAVELLRRESGVESGAELQLIKRIPSAAGLGGASSDAAAALVAASCTWKLGYDVGRLARLAAELGSDVPFFLGTGAAVCRGRGERIEPVADPGRLHVVVVCPPAGLSTRKVYEHCRPLAGEDRLGPLLESLRSGRVDRVAGLLRNDLQRTAEELSPWVGRLKREFDRTDCPGHQMSGSGTSYFGICRNARHARRIAARLRTRSIGMVYPAKTVFTVHLSRPDGERDLGERL